MIYIYKLFVDGHFIRETAYNNKIKDIKHEEWRIANDMGIGSSGVELREKKR